MPRKFLVAASMGVLVLGFGGPHGASAQTLEEMRRMLEQQQRMIEQMQRQQKEMERRFAELQAKTQQAEQAAHKAEASAAKAETAASETKQATQTAKTTVTNANERISVEISGQVNRMITVSNDGQSTDVFHVDNDNSSTRARLVGKGKIDDEMSVGAKLEVELQANDSSVVSQTNQDSGSFTFNGRVAEVYFNHNEYGRLTIGQGSTASDNSAEVDLSGTNVIQYSSISSQAGGLMFYDNSSGSYGPSIGSVFSNFDGNGRTNRLRYDSPVLAGFSVAGDFASNRRWSVAANYALPEDLQRSSGLQYQGAVAFSQMYKPGNAHRLDGSGSLLHTETGLNLTVSAGIDFKENGREPWSFYVKPGWTSDELLQKMGPTNFSIDYGHSNWVNADKDPRGGTSSEAQTIGFAVVQQWQEYGVEFYGGYRWHTLDESAASYDDIHVISAGTRVKF